MMCASLLTITPCRRRLDPRWIQSVTVIVGTVVPPPYAVASNMSVTATVSRSPSQDNLPLIPLVSVSRSAVNLWFYNQFAVASSSLINIAHCHHCLMVLVAFVDSHLVAVDLNCPLDSRSVTTVMYPYYPPASNLNAVTTAPVPSRSAVWMAPVYYRLISVPVNLYRLVVLPLIVYCNHPTQLLHVDYIATFDCAICAHTFKKRFSNYSLHLICQN